MAVGNMLRVLKGNQETLISPANKDEYLKKGYSVIDEDGSVLEEGTKTKHAVEEELKAAKKRIAELELELRGYKESDSAESGGEPDSTGEDGDGQGATGEGEKKRGRKSSLSD